VNAEAMVAARQAVIDAYGPWRWHNVALPYGLFTIDAAPHGDNHRAVKFLQLAADLLRRPLAGLRVLDLGCGEGLYALEFAQHGAEVLAVEGRPANLAKCEFARRALALERVRFLQDDVRHVTAERFGRFDVVLCSGLLYHLDAPSAFALLREMRRMCAGVCLVDTRIALKAERFETFEGVAYGGAAYREHAPEASEAEKLADPGASLGNDESFWFTRHALANALADAGFTSVLEGLVPVPLQLRADRATFAAFPGPPVRAHNEVGHDLAARRWPADRETTG
jgi:2-polyprenyl-3-methyl-5-hydroxy-6-metoxy-1,4-benzoquinol methylase